MRLVRLAVEAGVPIMLNDSDIVQFGDSKLRVQVRLHFCSTLQNKESTAS